MTDDVWVLKQAALRDPSVLPPLTDEERAAFIAWWVRGWMLDAVRSAKSDGDAIAYMTWQRDNGTCVGPCGWQYTIPKRGLIHVVLTLPGPDAVPNRHGVLLGEPVRAGVLTFAQIVRMVRHGRPAVQLLLFAEVAS